MKKLIVLAIMIVLVGLAGGGWYLLREQFTPSIDLQNLQFTTVKEGSLRDTIEITGKVIPQVGAKIMVGSRTSGMVEELYVQVGDYVEKEDLIAVIDTRELDRQIAVVSRQMEEVDNQFEQVENRLKLQLESEKLRYEKAIINYNLARDEYERIADLYEREFATIREYNQAYERYRGLEKDIMAAEKDIQRLSEDQEYELRVHNSRINQLKEQLGIRQIQESYARIQAPISGVITHIDTQQGETVAASFQTPNFVEIVDTQRLEVEAYVSEVDIASISREMYGFFNVDAMRDKNFKVRVREITPRGEVFRGAVSFQVMLEINDDYQDLIYPEMTAYVRLIKDEIPSALYVDQQAVRFYEGKRWVFIVENGRIVTREVKTGISDGGLLQITEGLVKGEEILLRGLSGAEIRRILERS